jgi:hypothetical protein
LPGAARLDAADLGNDDVLASGVRSGRIVVIGAGPAGVRVGRIQNYKRARVVEVTHTTPPVKVREVIVGDPAPTSTSGWHVYRSMRLPSLYP